jgi:spore coat protein U domain-containing protein, fimbrial subunit CupE1/2/3/6
MWAGTAFAATNQPVSVTGNVVADCTTMPLSGSLPLGTYNPFTSTDLKPAPFQFSINCTLGDTNLNVAVDGGANYANATPSGDRALKDASGHYLTYQLYTDSTYATAWPFSTSGGAGTAINLTAGGIGTANTISLYGVVPQGQTNTDAGSYTDTIHVTVNY